MFLEVQLQYLLWLQNIREATNGVFNSFFFAVSNFGKVMFAMLFIALIYWCLNKKAGEFLILNMGFCMLCSQLAKMTACISRPWLLNDKIKPVSDAVKNISGYSFPSGHTSVATALWGGLAFWLWDNKKIRYSLFALVLLVAFSRNYLGVHTVQDVLFSIIAGVLISLGVKKFVDKVDLQENADLKFFITGLGCAIITLGIVLYKYNHLESQNFIEYVQQMPLFYYNVGLVVGSISGWYLCRKFIPFGTVNMSWQHRLLRYIPGLLMSTVLFMFLVKSLTEEIGECKGNFLGAIIIGIFITFIYPWLFTRVEKKIKFTKTEV